MKPITQKQIKSKIRLFSHRIESYNCKMDAFKARIDRLVDKENLSKWKIKSLQTDCGKIGHIGTPCAICHYPDMP